MADLMNPGADSKCSESSILELFAADQALTDSQFLDAVNDPNATSLISGTVNLPNLVSRAGLNYYHSHVARMFQASLGRSGKQQQQQNTPNLGMTISIK